MHGLPWWEDKLAIQLSHTFAFELTESQLWTDTRPHNTFNLTSHNKPTQTKEPNHTPTEASSECMGKAHIAPLCRWCQPYCGHHTAGRVECATDHTANALVII